MGTYRNVKKLDKRHQFRCGMCYDHWTKQVDVYQWDPLVIPGPSLNICKKCARREIGSKNKKGWEQLNDL